MEALYQQSRCDNLCTSSAKSASLLTIKLHEWGLWRRLLRLLVHHHGHKWPSSSSHKGRVSLPRPCFSSLQSDSLRWWHLAMTSSCRVGRFWHREYYNLLPLCEGVKRPVCLFVQACAFEHCLSGAALAWIQGLIKSTNMFFLLSLNSILSILLTLKHTWLHSTCTPNQSTKETTCPTIPTCIGWRSCVLLLVLSNPIKLPVVHFGGRSGRNCRDAYWKRVSWKWKGFLCIHIDVTAWQLQERDSCSKQKLFHRIFFTHHDNL